MRILVVGQTPPPFGGQALMIQRLLQGNSDEFDLIHVRMDFSRNMGEIGKLSFTKILKLFSLIMKILYLRVRTNANILYYPPAGLGDSLFPIYRDIVLLNCVRWAFSFVVFHFHAGGVGEVYSKLSKGWRFLYEKAYFYPSASIRISEFAPNDGDAIYSQKNFIVPNGIEDVYQEFDRSRITKNTRCKKILYVGALFESKGVFELLCAGKLLRDQGVDFQIRLVGEGDRITTKKIERFIHENKLEKQIVLVGVKTGGDKWEEYCDADIFAFPSYFETFGLSLLEAMMFELPIVTTNGGAIPFLVTDEVNGLIVPVRHCVLFAQKIKVLIENPEYSRKLGTNGRQRFLQNYTVHDYVKKMHQVFSEIQEG